MFFYFQPAKITLFREISNVFAKKLHQLGIVVKVVKAAIK